MPKTQPPRRRQQRKRPPRPDAMEAQIKSLQRQVKQMKTPSQSSKRPKRQKMPRTPKSAAVQSTLTLPGPVQKFIMAGTVPSAAATKGAYIPANVRDSQKYDATFRMNFTVPIGCSWLYFDHPCPNSDMPCGTLYVEQTVGYFATAKLLSASVYPTNAVRQCYNNSEYGYNAPDIAGALVRYAGGGITVEHIGTHTARFGIIDAVEKIGDDDAIYSQAEQSTLNIADLMTRMANDQKALHPKWKAEGVMEFTHLNHDIGWYQFAASATNTLAIQAISPAYTCGSTGWYEKYGFDGWNHVGGDPTFIVGGTNNTGVIMPLQIKGVGHFERTSEAFPHKHSPSHDFALELGRVLPAFFAAKKAHSAEPDTHISSLVNQHITTHTASRNSESLAGRLLSSAAKAASKPKNTSAAIGLAMALL